MADDETTRGASRTLPSPRVGRLSRFTASPSTAGELAKGDRKQAELKGAQPENDQGDSRSSHPRARSSMAHALAPGATEKAGGAARSGPVSDPGCLSEDQILAYLEGRTTTKQRDQIDVHLDGCQSCWSLVDALLGDVRVPSEELPSPFRITTFSVGSLIAGRYKVERFIGKGGMGEVYRAHDTLMLKVVALKTPLVTSCDDPSALRKFFDEARNADRITHANICRVYALQEHKDPREDRPTVPFFTMEYIEGETLAARLKRGPLPLLAVRSIARQLLLGLCAAHEKRVLHLDFKSDNVMLRRGSSGLEAVIMDFGLSRQRDAVLRASQYQRGIGTVQYMALEQLEGQKNLTPAVDVYAFGVVLFEMLTRRLPYRETSLGAMLLRQQRERSPLVSEVRPGLDPALDQFVGRCLSRTAAKRYEDARAALVAFDALPAWTGRPARTWARRIEVVAGAAVVLGLLASPASEVPKDKDMARVQASLHARAGQPAPSKAVSTGAKPPSVLPTPGKEALQPTAPAAATEAPATAGVTPDLSQRATVTPDVTAKRGSVSAPSDEQTAKSAPPKSSPAGQLLQGNSRQRGAPAAATAPERAKPARKAPAPEVAGAAVDTNPPQSDVTPTKGRVRKVPKGPLPFSESGATPRENDAAGQALLEP